MEINPSETGVNSEIDHTVLFHGQIAAIDIETYSDGDFEAKSSESLEYLDEIFPHK